jgi:signal transduction histidine kinase
MVGLDDFEPTTFVNLAGQTLVALAFAAAAITPATKRVAWRTRTLVLVGCVAGAVLVIAQVITFSGVAGSAGAGPAGAGSALDHPALLGLRIATIAMLAAAAIAFVRSRDYRHDDPHILAAVAVLLAGSRAQYLVLPKIEPAWLTPGCLLRVAAYALMVTFAVRQHARTRQEAAQAAVRAERERIARDLHDGIAQDLAFIAAHRHRLSAEFGAEHPIMVAASRALAVSRGTMADLAASAAPSTASALHEVAEEIEERHGARIVVKADPADDEGLSAGERDELVRIAREAMVNAVKHGDAKKIIVELGSKKRNMLLRVSDDGCGIPAELPAARRDDQGGFGLPAMHARAASLGGRLFTRGGTNGGTEVKVMVS